MLFFSIGCNNDACFSKYQVFWAIARAACAEGRELVSQRLAKSYTALQAVRHRFNIYAGSCVALAL